MIFLYKYILVLIILAPWPILSTAYSLRGGVEVLQASDVSGEVSTRVVGGTPVALGDYKFYVNSMQNSLCGGTLIHDDIILTAAHCNNAFLVGNKVLVGSIDRRYATDGGVTRYIEAQVKHPQYSSFTQNFDFMLVKVTEPVWTIAPATFNDDFFTPDDSETATVIGFGYTSEGGSISNSLMKVDVPIVSHSECAQQYSSPIIKASMLCAGKEGSDSCQGDSGGPLMTLDPLGNPVVVGVVSFGVGCARASHAGVYARVSAVNSWIKQEICNLSMMKPSYCNPTPSPTPAPTPNPTPAPTDPPTPSPTTPRPTPAPTNPPTDPPTNPPTGSPTAQPSSSPTFTPATSANLKITISYGPDAEPQGRFWEIDQAGTEIRKGPEKLPQPNSNEVVFVDDLPFGQYDFSAYDLSINGSSDWIRIYQTFPNQNKPDVLLIEGGGDFIYKMTMPFTASQNPVPFNPPSNTTPAPATSSPTTSPTQTSPSQDPTKATVKITVNYDSHPEQTIWRFRRGYSQYIYWGPVSPPPAFSQQEEIIHDLEFGDDYNILFSDGAYDGINVLGQNPFVSVVQILPDGTEQPVASSSANFGYSFKLSFALSAPPTSSPVFGTTSSPTKSPLVTTASPTSSPTRNPTTNPSSSPTTSPTSNPSSSPTASPTSNPTSSPTASPTNSPTTSPTESMLTSNPTTSPTRNPSESPTISMTPTASPTASPTTSPTEEATLPKTAAVKIRFMYDDHPSQTTWRLRKGFTNYIDWGPKVQLAPFAEQTEIFDGLEFGSDYSILFSDKGYNGFSGQPSDQPFVIVSRILYNGEEQEIARSNAAFGYGHVLSFTLEPETWAPSASPTTASPTSSPTSSPTLAPVTSSPTASPTVSPTTSPTDVPTTSPTSNPTSSPTLPVAAPSTARVKVVVNYDDFPQHTRWEIKQGNTPIFSGPVLTPAPLSTQTQTWSVFPLGAYTFTIYDDADNGMMHLDFFRVYKILDDGTEELLAHGNEAFESSYTAPFIVKH